MITVYLKCNVLIKYVNVPNCPIKINVPGEIADTSKGEIVARK